MLAVFLITAARLLGKIFTALAGQLVWVGLSWFVGRGRDRVFDDERWEMPRGVPEIV